MFGRNFEPYLKGGFSERKGIKEYSKIVQINDLTPRTRNQLFNAIRWYFEHFDESDLLTKYVYIEIFSKIEEDIPIEFNRKMNKYYDRKRVLEDIHEFFASTQYYYIFDFLEAFLNIFNTSFSSDEYKELHKKLNNIFKEENVNYRLVDGIITDLTSEMEIESINNTINNKYEVVNKHFSNALELLYHARNYNNSIKESISAVEAMCQIIIGKEKATLGEALDLLKSDIHPAMKSAFDKLYGYTSDANGIRHANGLAEGNATIEEARYMLVSCSAFINYLKEIFEKKEK